jgi:hypothetical protein
MHGAGRRCVGPGVYANAGAHVLGADSSRVRDCGRKRNGRKRGLMGGGGWDRARTQSPRADGRQFARSHCDRNTCLGANGCDIRRGPERVHVVGGAGARGYRRGARGYRGGGIN